MEQTHRIITAVPIGPGTKLGQYDVQEFIGQGAMGLVYRAYHPQLERTGAVKVMQAISPDADTVARFRHEAQAIAQLRHPNIIDVYDFGEYQGTPYMVVEYVPGGSLATKINQGGITRATALRYLRGIAAGLDYAHKHGVVHRDVKPANVLLTADDTPVIADFGLAKLLQGSSLRSMTGVTTGTPAYMAPEQVAGHQVGPPADRYSLATIAYEMLTGVIPFDGEALMELLYAQVHREPLVPSARNLGLGPQVDAVIMRGLAKDPAARWESCTAFVDALDGAMAGKPAPVAATTMVLEPPALASTVPLAAAPVAVKARSAPETVAMAYPAPAAPVGAAKRKPRWGFRALVAAIVVVALLILLLVSFAALQQPTLALSSTTVVPGESVVVSAAHVPANQAGEIQLWSVLHTFPFRANGSGNVAIDMTVPRDVGLGDHLVKLCWSGTCQAQTTLHVVGRLGLASPTPIANTTPGTTPGATPGATPTAAATPRSTPRPTSTPGATPKPAPTPSPKSSPTPSPYVTLVSVSATLNTTVTFHYFYGASTSIQVCQNGSCSSPIPGTVSVTPGSASTVAFKTPLGIKPTSSLLGIGPAYVTTGCCGATNSVPVSA